MVAPVTIDMPDGVKFVVKRATPQTSREQKEEIDPNNVCVVDANQQELAGMLIAQLIQIRAQKKALDDQDTAIKNMLQEMAGAQEYLALAEGDKPLVSLKYESSIRIKTAVIKEQFPPENFPDFYQQSSSRPLRIM